MPDDEPRPYWELPKQEKPSVLGYAVVALIIFVVGAAVLIIGMVADARVVMLVGAVLIVAGGGWAGLLGDRLVDEIGGSQGGRAARRAGKARR